MQVPLQLLRVHVRSRYLHSNNTSAGLRVLAGDIFSADSVAGLLLPTKDALTSAASTESAVTFSTTTSPGQVGIQCLVNRVSVSLFIPARE